MNRTELSSYGRLCWITSALSTGMIFAGLLLADYYMAGGGLIGAAGFGASAYIEFVKTFPDPDA